MRAFIIDARTLLVPLRAETENGPIGDGMERIGPEHPDYNAWAEVALPYPAAWRAADEERRREAAKAAQANVRRRARRAAAGGG